MIGTVVGTYRITRKLGEGGMGTVYEGVDEMIDREVAIKVLRHELVADPRHVERFRSEAKILAKLNHPHIATLYGFLFQDGDYFMVMEFVRGIGLDDMIAQRGALPYPVAVGYFCQALEGIEDAHRHGIVHRDIKPSNIMVTTDDVVKVMDFGIARAAGSAHVTRAGMVVGTLEYISPEQIRGLETDARSDIYSLGVVLFEMLTGRVPFATTNEFELMQLHLNSPLPSPRLFNPDIPEPIAQAVARATEKDPAARFQSAAEFRAALQGAVSMQVRGVPAFAGPVLQTYQPVTPTETAFQQPITPEDEWPTPLPVSPQRKSPRGLIAAAAAMLLIFAVGGGIYLGVVTNREPSPAPVVMPGSIPSAPSQPEPARKEAPPADRPMESPGIPKNEPGWDNLPVTPLPTEPVTPGAKAPEAKDKKEAKQKKKSPADIERERKRKEALKALDQ